MGLCSGLFAKSRRSITKNGQSVALLHAVRRYRGGANALCRSAAKDEYTSAYQENVERRQYVGNPREVQRPVLAE